MNRFKGKVAIVAGGASGIGLASARRLASEGATVVVADLDLAAAEAAAAGIDRASAAWYDAEDPGSVRAMIDAAVGRAGRLDVLHNNAALLVPEVMAADTAAGDIDLAVWDRVMAVNLRGYLAATQAPDGSWPQVATVDRVAFDFVATDASGQSHHMIAVYLRRGRALMGIYFPQPDGPQAPVDGQTTIAGIVNVFATRMANLAASAVNGG